MTTTSKLTVVAFSTFCAWVLLFLGWISYYNFKFRKAGIIKPGDLVATDVSGMLLSLFHSPWYCLELATIVAAAVVLGRRWVS